MEQVFQFIVCILIVIGLFFLAMLTICALIWIIAIKPFCIYYLKKSSNKLQWKAEETDMSRQYRLGILELAKEKFSDRYELKYRILPSELPFIVNVFGNNYWKTFDINDIENYQFKDKNDFIEFVSKFKSLDDMIKYKNEMKNKIKWVYP